MEKGNSLSLRAYPGMLIDEANSGGPASLQGRVQVIDGKANVVNPGSALCDEPSDGRVVGLRLEEFDHRLAGSDAGDPCSVGVIQRHLGHFEHVAVEWQHLVERAHGDSNVCDAGAAAR
jgi:hypothetical protein